MQKKRSRQQNEALGKKDEKEKDYEDKQLRSCSAGLHLSFLLPKNTSKYRKNILLILPAMNYTEELIAELFVAQKK